LIIYRGWGGGRFIFRVPRLVHPSLQLMTVVTARAKCFFLDCRYLQAFPAGGEKMRILIAEDDVALAGFVRKGLEAEHYAVDVSADGEQARALASELDYDLIVLDLNLSSAGGSSNPQGR